jgi:hypothetical protein
MLFKCSLSSMSQLRQNKLEYFTLAIFYWLMYYFEGSEEPTIEEPLMLLNSYALKSLIPWSLALVKITRIRVQPLNSCQWRDGKIVSNSFCKISLKL